MHKKRALLLSILLLSAAIVALYASVRNVRKASSVRLDRPSQRTLPAAYFKTPFQSEPEFIVHAIVSDIAEQISFAASHHVPGPKDVSVSVKEKPGSPDAPVYELQIQALGKLVTTSLTVDGPIWSPAIYRKVVSELARSARLAATGAIRTDTTLFAEWSNLDANTIETENRSLSEALEKNFVDPALHEKAGLLLGAFLLREHSGDFFEIRSPLCRISAHLAMANFLRDNKATSPDGVLAEAVLLSLVNDQSPALARLNALDTNSSGAASIVRGLRIRNSGDYRLAAAPQESSRFERVEWYMAMAGYADAPSAWLKLGNKEKSTVDFVRAANQTGYSVEIGHQLLGTSLPLEFKEIESVYSLARGSKLSSQSAFAAALNELPEYCFSADSSGAAHVRVIGWGQWAAFFQRHLCHAIRQNYHFMYVQWGVYDDAKEFASRCDGMFKELRLYPFVRRFNCSDEAAYHTAVDDGFKVTVATPHLVPAECWNYLCYHVRFAPPYDPNPNPHVNEWHNDNPPPGTVYDLGPRLDHPSLISRGDAVAKFEQLRTLAPYDCRIIDFILNKKFGDHPTYDQALAMYKDLLPYSVHALWAVAKTVRDNNPSEYEKLMLHAADLNPSYNYDLGIYACEHHQDDKAEAYYDKACENDPDAVRAASYAAWRVRYYLKNVKIEKARTIADDAAEVYSHLGLEAKAIFCEATTNYDCAFEVLSNIEKRYDDSTPLLRFCMRYKATTGNNRFEPELQKRLPKLFPKGLEKVSLSDFAGPPADGVVIWDSSDLLTSAGMQAGDIIVAAYDVRVHNQDQYTFARDIKDTPELAIIVWHNNAYHEFKASPPNHLFGVELEDYKTQPSKHR